jgi:hypothetical protein
MGATPNRPEAADADESDDRLDEQPPATPDEDGPHDVPDDAVIEKTLPKPARPGR